MHLIENKKSILAKESGQALVEYILLISISVALVLAFATQFYKPLGNWMQNPLKKSQAPLPIRIKKENINK